MGGLSAVLIYVLKIILIFTSFCLISVLKKVSEMSPPKKSQEYPCGCLTTASYEAHRCFPESERTEMSCFSAYVFLCCFKKLFYKLSSALMEHADNHSRIDVAVVWCEVQSVYGSAVSREIVMLANFVLNEAFDHLNKHAVVKDSSGHQPMLIIKTAENTLCCFW